MMRRLIGDAHVRDIEEIKGIEKKLAVEIATLEFGSKLVKNYHEIETMSEFMAYLET